MKDINEVREIFKADRFATLNGAVIDEIGEDFAKCSLTVGDNHKTANGGVMGGVMFMLADFAFAVAVNREVMRTVSISSNIDFVGVCKGSRLIATASCVKNGRNVCYYNIEICDDLGNKVAVVSITGFNKN